MGYCKVKLESPRRIRFVHQLDHDGTAYAEDVTIELQDGVDPERLAYLAAKDGQVGVLNYTFIPTAESVEGVRFPE